MADWTTPDNEAVDKEWTTPDNEAVAAPYKPGMIMSALKNIQHAATFGQDDRINAAIGAINPFSKDTYDTALAKNQALQKQTEENPWVAVPAQVAGNLIPGVPIMRASNAIAKGVTGVAANVLRGGTAGAVQGGLAGAGSADTPSEIIPNAVAGAKAGAVVGGALPGVAGAFSKATSIPVVGPKLAEFAKNYSDLSPKITGKIGPMTYGGVAGAAAPSVGGLSGIQSPVTITPEDWSSDPVSAFGKTAVGFGLGMAGGKAIKTMGQAGGALQKTIKGGPPEGGIPAVTTTPVTPPPPPAGTPPVVTPSPEPAPRLKLPADMETSQPGVTDVPPIPTKVPATAIEGPKPVAGTEGADSATQRQAAMAQLASAEGRATTNGTSPQQTNSTQEYFKQLQDTTIPEMTQVAQAVDIAPSEAPSTTGEVTPQLADANVEDGMAALQRFGQLQKIRRA